MDIKNREDIEEFIQKSGCDSAMIARSAQWNPSVFLSKTSTPIPFDSVVKDYLRLMIRYVKKKLFSFLFSLIEKKKKKMTLGN